MSDIFNDHYDLLRTDADARRRLVENPKAELARFFGPLPAGDYQVQIIEQRPDTITVVLPTPPDDPEDIAARLGDVAGRVLDLLHTSGIGGYLVPNQNLTWTLRDMRSRWAQNASR